MRNFTGFGAGGLLLASALIGPAIADPVAGVPAIALEPHDDQWRVRYTLTAPATSLQFARSDRHGNRARTWQAVDQGFELVLADEVEVIRRRDGEPFEQVAFDVPPRYMPLEKDYAPFSPFGDGGLLIHSGRFQVCADDCVGSDDPSWSFTVTPPVGQHLIQGGKVSVGPVRFDDRGNGTNLYVGAAVPIENAHVVAVVDRAFPSAAREQLEALLPRLMDFFAERLGALEAKPMLFASSDEQHPGGGYGYQGGTLPGQVFVHLYGRHDAFERQEFADRMSWFFAHEAAHLFQRYPPDLDASDSWIHEGGADAMAALAVSGLGVAGADDIVAGRVRSAVDACAASTAERSLKDAAAAGDVQSAYECGLLMQMAVDAAARRASNGDCDLFCVWRDFQTAVARGAGWNRQSFLAVVEARAGTNTAAFLRGVAAGRQPDSRGYLLEGLADAGAVGFDGTATMR